MDRGFILLNRPFCHPTCLLYRKIAMSHIRKVISSCGRLWNCWLYHVKQHHVGGHFLFQRDHSMYFLYSEEHIHLPLRWMCSSKTQSNPRRSNAELSLTPQAKSLLLELKPLPYYEGNANVSPAVIGNFHLLYGLGMTNDDIKLCEYKHDGFLRSVYMNSHVQFLQSLHLNDADICNIMQRVPRFFTSAPYISQNIVQYMIDIGLSKKNLRNLLIFSPSLFYRVKGRPQQIGNLLQGIMKQHHPEVDVTPILARMIRDDIKLFNRTVKEVQRNLRFLNGLGITGTNLVKVMHYCPSALRIGTDFLHTRWTYLQKKLRLNNQEMIDCVIKHPRILTLGDDKIKEKFDFLYNKAGFQPADVARNPRLFERSLQHLEGRYKILQEVNYTGDFIPLLTTWGKVFDERVARMRLKSKNAEQQPRS